MTTRLTLIRHGETDWNVSGTWQGIAPVPLNDNGIKQVRVAAPYLQNAGITRIISSDLKRCRQTAEIVAEQLNLPVVHDQRWREIDLGRWQGLKKAEIMTWDGDAYNQFQASEYLSRQFPDGESQQQHIDRTTQAMLEIALAYASEHILIVTHGGSIRCALYQVNKERTHLSGNCTLTRFVFDQSAEVWRVIAVSQEPETVKWD